jgi:hypothetical protein
MPKTKPRISINKLGEYCETTSTLRRKQIVKDAKDPKSFKVTRYSEARSAIQDYLVNNRDSEIILRAIENIRQKPNNTDFQKSDNILSEKALNLILESDLTFLDDFDIRKSSENNTIIEIAGVRISVYPDFILSKHVNNDTFIGGIKLHITVGGLKRESQKIVSTVLYQYIRDVCSSKDQIADLTMCFSYDIFKKQLESAPGSHARRMQRVFAACEEIALWWDNL